jgi:cytochrome c oxidase assembly protein subunit 15
LFIVAGLVFVMVVLGGATRLTHSGLSMVEWRPITGWLPPLSEAAWQDAFRAYQKYPEYQKVNPGMTLAGFKEIFWLEYLHRLSGRVLGIVFFVPFGIFLFRRWIDRPLAWRLAALFLLGGLQGALGWYMVKSGLVSRPDVSQYRLVAHLGLALVIYGLLIWIALGLLRAPPVASPAAGSRRRGAFGLAALVFLTILSGGFVAGTDAGFGYNTFPLMNGELIPDGLFGLQPALRSLFEDPTTIQFNHRLLATLTLLAVIAYWWTARRGMTRRRCRIALHGLLIAVLGQYALGVATLLMVVPVPLGIAHQSGAVVVWTAALWLAFEVSRQRHAAPARMAAMAEPESRNRPAIAG